MENHIGSSKNPRKVEGGGYTYGFGGRIRKYSDFRSIECAWTDLEISKFQTDRITANELEDFDFWRKSHQNLGNPNKNLRNPRNLSQNSKKFLEKFEKFSRKNRKSTNKSWKFETQKWTEKKHVYF